MFRDEPPKILLVEDDETLAEITSFRLELLGYGVTMVQSGDEVLAETQRQLPDLVILDLAIPGMDGIELINRLQNDERTTAIPILTFSTDADLNTVQRAFTAGAKDYLVTPYDPAVLERKIERLLERSQTVN